MALTAVPVTVLMSIEASCWDTMSGVTPRSLSQCETSRTICWKRSVYFGSSATSSRPDHTIMPPNTPITATISRTVVVAPSTGCRPRRMSQACSG